MFTMIHEQKINISHFLSLDYDSKDSRPHGHILTIRIKLFSTRLNPHNMVVDTNVFKRFIDSMNNNSLNEYMRTNNIRGNATLENLCLIIKTHCMMLLSQENAKYNSEAQLISIEVIDENGRQVIYNCQ